MEHDERFLKSRRNIAATATTAATNGNGKLNGRPTFSADDAENGLVPTHHQHPTSSSSIRNTTPTTSVNLHRDQRRQRLRTRRKGHASNFRNPVAIVISTLQKRTTQFLRRHPEKLPHLVGAVLVGGLGVCLIVSAVIHSLMPSNTTGHSFEKSPLSLSSSSSRQGPHHTTTYGNNNGGPLLSYQQQRRTQDQKANTNRQQWRKVRPYDLPKASAFDVVYHRHSVSDQTIEKHKNYQKAATTDNALHLSPVLADPVILVSPPPPIIDEDAINEWYYIDYGGLELSFFEEPTAHRQIVVDYGDYKTEYRDLDITPPDDDQDAYFALDDDVIRNEFADRKQDDHGDLQCRRIKEHRINYQTCNNVHELALLDMNVHFLGEGSYRAVVGLEHDLGTTKERVAMKDILYERDNHIDVYEYSRMDAMVAERLTASPHIFDIYGFCGLSIVSEFFEHGDIEKLAVPNQGALTDAEVRQVKDQDGPLTVFNDISPSEKLRMALQMAEGIADLHGNVGGVIVHQDVQLAQFLFNSDKSILKLNDFNRAEFMLWNEKDGEYCKYTEFVGHGSWRSPEEYFDNPLDEKVDLYSLGNNMYSILTGLWVFFDEPHTSKIQERIKNGETAYIDTRFKDRSFEEAKLVEAIEWCHQYHPEDRPSAFLLVSFLREAVEESKRRSAAELLLK